MGDLVHAHAFLAGAIEVVVGRKARFLRGLHEDRPKAVGAAQVHHIQRPAAGMPFIGAALVVLGFQEVGQHIVVAPAHIAFGGPVVVVFSLATDVDHGIDRTGTAQHLAARLVTAPPTQTSLRRRFKSPIRLAVFGQDHEPSWAMDERAAVNWPRFQQANRHLGVFAQT